MRVGCGGDKCAWRCCGLFVAACKQRVHSRTCRQLPCAGCIELSADVPAAAMCWVHRAFGRRAGSCRATAVCHLQSVLQGSHGGMYDRWPEDPEA
eukprot:358605-Chlamydomonas_euryale.AAC.8